MNLRAFGHAVQFLTRLPTPRFADFRPEDLSRSASWFPIVGALVGALLALVFWAGHHASPWIAALVTLIAWIWVTGGLHLDGLGDVADALAASHRAPERLLDVMRDPHVGAFGAMAIALQMIAKVVLLAEIAGASAFAALALVPAWARWGPLVWSLTVPPLAQGSGERFAWQINPSVTAVYGVCLAALSLWLAPVLIAALVIVPVISMYWRYRLGGITGDCLGASVEVTETLLLLLLAIAVT